MEIFIYIQINSNKMCMIKLLKNTLSCTNHNPWNVYLGPVASCRECPVTNITEPNFIKNLDFKPNGKTNMKAKQCPTL